MKLSFCVTFANQNKYIDRAISSIIKIMGQRTDYEILVGLDNPDSEAEKLVQKFDDKTKLRTFVLHSDPRFISLSRAAMNRAFLLKQAEGEYAMILDGDDFYIDFPNEAIHFLDTNLNYSAHAHCFKFYSEAKDLLFKSKPPYRNQEDVTLERHLRENKYFHSNCLVFRKSLLDENAPVYCNDTALTCYLLSKGPIKFSQKEIMGYTVGIPSIYAGSSDTLKCLSSFVMLEEMMQRHTNCKKYLYKKMRKVLRNFGNKLGKDVPDEYRFQVVERNLPITKYLYESCEKNYLVRKAKLFGLRAYLSYMSKFGCK